MTPLDSDQDPSIAGDAGQARCMAKDPVLRLFLETIAPLRSRIEKIVLFGSHARGKWRESSDYDLLIVLENKTPELERTLYDAAETVSEETQADVSLKLYSHNGYEQLRSLKAPLFMNILREGISLG